MMSTDSARTRGNQERHPTRPSAEVVSMLPEHCRPRAHIKAPCVALPARGVTISHCMEYFRAALTDDELY